MHPMSVLPLQEEMIQAFYQMVFEFVTDAILLIAREGRILQANQSAQQLLQVSKLPGVLLSKILRISADQSQALQDLFCQAESFEYPIHTGERGLTLSCRLFSDNLWFCVLTPENALAIQHQQNEQLLSTLIAQLPIPVSIFQGNDGKVCYSNELVPEPYFEAPSLSATRLIYEKIPQEYASEYCHVLKTKQIPVFEPNGQVSHIVQVSESLSTREATTSHLYERCFRRLIETGAIGILFGNMDGTILDVNQALAELLGYTKCELLKQNWNNLLHPDDTESCEQFFTNLAQQDITAPQEKLLLTKEGQGISVMVSVAITDEEHQEFIACVVDIQHQKQTEEALLRAQDELEEKVQKRTAALSLACEELRDKTTVMENALEGIAHCDEQGVFLNVNKAYAAMYGYEPEELIGKSWTLIAHPDDIPNIVAKYTQENHLGKVEMEIRGVRKDSSIFYVHFQLLMNRDEAGQTVSHFSFIKDITERRCMEEEREAMLTRLREYVRRIQNVVSMLTHDLRTPLIAQGRVLETLHTEKSIQKNPKLLNLLESFMQNNKSLLQMINNLLETYELEEGHIKVLLEPINLFNLINLCYEDLTSLARSKQINLFNRIPMNWITLNADTLLLTRLFHNLIGNAINNIQQGGMIEISAQQNEESVEIRVQDNGPGIPPDILPSLFQQYHLNRRIRKKIGSGLGLYICKMIVELHQGSIQVQSSTGTGTCIILTLPLNLQLRVGESDAKTNYC